MLLYETIINPFFPVIVKAANFISKKNSSEVMLMFRISDKSLSFEQQLDVILSFLNRLCAETYKDASIVFERFFLSDAANQQTIIQERNNAACAVSIVEQPPLDGTKIALWVYLQTKVIVKPLSGGIYSVENGEYTHLWTSSANTLAVYNSEDQARYLFNEYVEDLNRQGCKLERNVVRTWIFVQNIDCNYAGVVKARNEVFAANGLTKETHFVASTGIQGRSSDPKQIVKLDAYSVKGLKKEQIQYLYAPTHMNKTIEYGVSFERGTCVHYADRKHVFISGTASIDNHGMVMFPRDVKKQTLRVLENVKVLLNEAECDFSDVSVMIVYLRDMSDYNVVEYMYSEYLPNIPTVFLLAPVCRPQWLVEMECIAIKKYGAE